MATRGSARAASFSADRARAEDAQAVAVRILGHKGEAEIHLDRGLHNACLMLPAGVGGAHIGVVDLAEGDFYTADRLGCQFNLGGDPEA